MTGTVINVGAILADTLIGVLAGARLPEGLQRRVLAGLGLVTFVIGVDLALAWRDTSPLYVLGGVLLGGLTGEALRIEDRLARLGDRIQRRVERARGSSSSNMGISTAAIWNFRQAVSTSRSSSAPTKQASPPRWLRSGTCCSVSLAGPPMISAMTSSS